MVSIHDDANVQFVTGLNKGGTGADLSATGAGVLVQATTGAAVTVTASPAITSFANATHTHANAAGGGTLAASAIASGQLAIARGGTGADMTVNGPGIVCQTALGAAFSTMSDRLSDFTPTIAAQGATFTDYLIASARSGLVTLKLCYMHVRVSGGSVSALSPYIYIAIPNGRSAATFGGYSTVAYRDNGTYGTGFVAASGGYVYIHKDLDASTNWAISTTNTSFTFQIIFELA